MGRIWKMIRWKDSVCTLRLAWEIPWYQPLNQNCEFFTVFPILLENIYKAFSKTVLLANVITNLLREWTWRHITRRKQLMRGILEELTPANSKHWSTSLTHAEKIWSNKGYMSPCTSLKPRISLDLYMSHFFGWGLGSIRNYPATVLIVFLLIVNFI